MECEKTGAKNVSRSFRFELLESWWGFDVKYHRIEVRFVVVVTNSAVEKICSNANSKLSHMLISVTLSTNSEIDKKASNNE